ncbi:hypothetical protein ACP275_01G026700 [Erythranthe tilingii]
MIVRKEIEILKESALEAKATAVKFRKKNDDAMEQIEELQRHYGVAARVCEEAIAKKETIEKSYHEKMSLLCDCGLNAVLDHSYVASADRVGLSRYCKNNVEKFMKWWNEDEEFRREYARHVQRKFRRGRSHVADYKERATSSNKHGSKKCKKNNRNKN